MFFKKKNPSPTEVRKGNSKNNKKNLSNEGATRNRITPPLDINKPRHRVSTLSAPMQITARPKPSKAKKSKQVKHKPPKKKEYLKDGTIIGTRTKWKVISMLGAGGFGEVYKVVIEKPVDGIQPEPNKENKESGDEKVNKDNNNKVSIQDSASSADARFATIVPGVEYAMKTESYGVDKFLARLKIELNVLTAINKTEEENRKKHFCDLYDRGQHTDGTKYLVMSIVGPSVDNLRKNILGVTNFKQSTTLQIALQTLESITALHYLGYIHRDIKPANFACGLGDKQSIIYMLDFGIARFIFKSGTRELRPVRKFAKFIGTIRYAARAAQRNLEQGRKDDLETWLYMVYFLYDSEDGLPWKAVNGDKVLKLKDAFFRHELPSCYRIAPKLLMEIVDYLNSLCLTDEPDYKKIEDIIRRIADETKVSLTEPLEWIGKCDGAKARPTTDEKAPDERQVGNSKSDSSKGKKKSGDKADKKKEETKEDDSTYL